MLIAQIFNLRVGLQGNSNLLLIAWIGVIAAGYIFESRASLIIAMIEFFVWVNLQYLALVETSFFSNGFSFGMIALIDLVLGLLFYGLNLLHRSLDHKFSRTYQFWSLFYVLCFAYTLSFQMLLPLLWSQGFSMPGGALVYLLFLALISIALFAIASALAIGRKKIEFKEILVVVLAFFLFAIIIFSSGVLTGTAGSCHMKSCHEFNTESSCENVDFVSCEWYMNYCRQQSCYNYYGNETACKNADSILNCSWKNTSYGGECAPSTGTAVYYEYGDNGVCSKFNNDRKSCLSESEKCRWSPNSYFGYRGQSVPFSLMAFWILSNIIFILVILGVIGYGYLYKNAQIINLGIIFFVIDIITRYIGFIIDYWSRGYNVMAVLFILGGIILLFGGWAIEKFRRKLIKDVRGNIPSDEEESEEEE
jgi:hypothetical protein